MWKKIDGRLQQTADTTRVKFRTNISKALLEHLQQLALEHETHVNYILETGMKRMLQVNKIEFDKTERPKDRIQYKTTYDQQLLQEIRRFAKEKNLFINDIIEYSSKYIDLTDVKDVDYKHRIEPE